MTSNRPNENAEGHPQAGVVALLEELGIERLLEYMQYNSHLITFTTGVNPVIPRCD